ACSPFLAAWPTVHIPTIAASDPRRRYPPAHAAVNATKPVAPLQRAIPDRGPSQPLPLGADRLIRVAITQTRTRLPDAFDRPTEMLLLLAEQERKCRSG